MPVMHFRVRWPDSSEMRCYSPSLVIKDYFVPGETYALDDFLSRSREALAIASERVRAKFGQPCSLALAQLDQIENQARRFTAEPGAQVRVIGLD
jgi:uncharacterized repeat protein (TIGR04042 family)